MGIVAGRAACSCPSSVPGCPTLPRTHALGENYQELSLQVTLLIMCILCAYDITGKQH